VRLAPIDTPKGILPRIAAYMTKRRLGKVMAPMRVVYPRFPALYRLSYSIMKIQERGLVLDPGLTLLVTTYVAGLNGCSFCADIGRALAVYGRHSLERLDAVSEWVTSERFSPAERAALAYAEAATREVHVKDAVFEALRSHFDERRIVEITWLVAIENYYNRLAGPLGLESDGLCEIAVERLGARRAPSASR
jgi:AhpD family alkylhydroperoxidase